MTLRFCSQLLKYTLWIFLTFLFEMVLFFMCFLMVLSSKSLQCKETRWFWLGATRECELEITASTPQSVEIPNILYSNVIFYFHWKIPFRVRPWHESSLLSVAVDNLYVLTFFIVVNTLKFSEGKRKLRIDCSSYICNFLMTLNNLWP